MCARVLGCNIEGWRYQRMYVGSILGIFISHGAPASPPYAPGCHQMLVSESEPARTIPRAVPFGYVYWGQVLAAWRPSWRMCVEPSVSATAFWLHRSAICLCTHWALICVRAWQVRCLLLKFKRWCLLWRGRPPALVPTTWTSTLSKKQRNLVGSRLLARQHLHVVVYTDTGIHSHTQNINAYNYAQFTPTHTHPSSRSSENILDLWSRCDFAHETVMQGCHPPRHLHYHHHDRHAHVTITRPHIPAPHANRNRFSVIKTTPKSQHLRRNFLRSTRLVY